LTAASCSFFRAAARTSAAATSMSCALACLATGATAGGGVGIGATTGALGLMTGAALRGGIGFADTLGTPAVSAGEAGDELAAGAATNTWRSRRATGASTVLDADLTNSPISFSLASTILLSTPSSFASSCTRALPATALLTPRPRGQVPASTSLVHLKPDHVSDFIVCSCRSSYLACPGGGSRPPPSAVPSGNAGCASPAPEGARLSRSTLPCGGLRWRSPPRYSANGPVSRTPVTRNARPKARRRSASAKHAGSGWMCAPRPGSLRVGSGLTPIRPSTA
jgi:hypothetical protein